MEWNWKNITILIIILIIFGVGYTTYLKANYKCEQICNKQKALDYRIQPGGGLTTIKNDICTCYFKYNTKTFKLGEYNETIP